MWYITTCMYEGPGADRHPNSVDFYVEAKDYEGFEEIRRRVREVSPKEFFEHSVREELTREADVQSAEEVKEEVDAMFPPDVAIFEDGRVYRQVYIEEGRFVEDK